MHGFLKSVHTYRHGYTHTHTHTIHNLFRMSLLNTLFRCVVFELTHLWIKLSFHVSYFYYSERQQTIQFCSLNSGFHFTLVLWWASAVFSLESSGILLALRVCLTLCHIKHKAPSQINHSHIFTILFPLLKNISLQLLLLALPTLLFLSQGNLSSKSLCLKLSLLKPLLIS